MVAYDDIVAYESKREPASVRNGWRRLAVVAAGIAATWLVVLPTVGKLDSMKAAIDAREARGIDTGAMFYTDLELMDDVLARSKKFHQQNPDALWRPGSRR